MERKYIRIDENGNFLADEWHEVKPNDDKLIETIPKGKFFLPKWDGEKWIEGKSKQEQLDNAKDNKLKEISDNYKKDLVSGLQSQITGTEKATGNSIPAGDIIFGYELIDQINLHKRYSSIIGGDAENTFDFGTKSHGVVTFDSTEFRKIGKEMENHEMLLYAKKKDLEYQVNIATTITEVNSIIWG